MSTVLTEFEEDVLALKNKFVQARKELQLDEVDNHRPSKMIHHPRSLAFAGNKQVERCE